MPTHEQTLLMSRLLDFHLRRTIERHTPMSKYSELADLMKSTKARLDGQVEDLASDLMKLATHGDEVVRRHRAVIETARAGFHELEDAVRELEGNKEEDESKVATFSDGLKKTG